MSHNSKSLGESHSWAGGSECPLAHKLGLREHGPPPRAHRTGEGHGLPPQRPHDAVCKVLSEAEMEQLSSFQEIPVSPDPDSPKPHSVLSQGPVVGSEGPHPALSTPRPLRKGPDCRTPSLTRHREGLTLC